VTGLRQSVLFVTDELFLPPYNGSSQVYLKTARHYASQGHEVASLSFYRDPRRIADPSTLAAYAEVFPEFIFLPGWNVAGSLLSKLSAGWRELLRYATGNVFSTSPLARLVLKPHEAAILDLAKRRRIDTIYFHKPQTVLLLRHLLPRLRPATIIVDLHDDFVERGCQYRLAYERFFAAVGPAEIIRRYAVPFIRHHLSRVDPARSRRAETELLSLCDQILVASQEEIDRYRLRAPLADRLVYRPWRFEPATRRPSRPSRPSFDAGFLGSDDIMNLDALIYLRDEIGPRIRRDKPDFRLLIAGSIAAKAGPLLAGLTNVTIWNSLADVENFYDAIGVAVVPLRYGTGVSIKVIEALSYGCPVVSTHSGVRGVPTAETAGISVADDAEAFAAAVIETMHRAPASA
jgi:glycosyltransferase involved in cell wall biosynthesis